MTIRLDSSDSPVLWAALLVLLGLIVLIGPKAGAPGVELKNRDSHYGTMMTLEMHADKASQLLARWDDEIRDKVRTAVMWDFAFIFVYVAFMGIATLLAALKLTEHQILPFEIGLLFVGAQLLAGLLDMIENVALLRILDESTASVWPQISRWCAIAKFSLIGLGLLFCTAAVLAAAGVPVHRWFASRS